VVIFSDFHIHSRFSRATSPSMDIEHLIQNGKRKGLDLMGTGDFTHPLWLKELRSTLRDEEGYGLLRPETEADCRIHFLLTSEVCTTFEFEGSVKRIHHLLLSPSFDHVDQINDRLSRFGNLKEDGRPDLRISAAELVDEVMSVSSMNEVIPAHIWTPWFSLFGAFSGFDSLVECYQDASKHIHALETGLSSDPPMNWQLSSLDDYVLVSNSDSHSPWPWRIGREANLFDLSEMNYESLMNAIREKDRSVLKGTIEVNPAYGKYHWTGHRKCAFSVPPERAVELEDICPICHRKLTKGVDQRVHELSDRPPGFIPEEKIPFRHLLPLSEIISTVIGIDSLYGRSIQEIYNRMIPRLGNEFQVLLSSPKENIDSLVGSDIAGAILEVRDDKVEVIPGYDGVYGQIRFMESPSQREERRDSADPRDKDNRFKGKLDQYL